MSDIPLVTASDGKNPQGGARDPVAETLLAEILPTSQPKPSETIQRAPTWPSDNRSGTRSRIRFRRGGRRGVVLVAVLAAALDLALSFSARDHAHSFAYVIDCSGSMATRNSLEVAKREMLASISQLPPDAQFAVIFYNLQARMLTDPLGKRGLMAATAPNKARVQTQLATIAPDGGTDHMTALRTALRSNPRSSSF